jgi:hypothetical protein
MVSWSEVIGSAFGGLGEETVQTLICVLCLTTNLNAAFPLKLVTYSRNVGGARTARNNKALLDIPPGLDGYQYFVEATWPGNSVRDKSGEEWNPVGQTLVNGLLLCAHHAVEELKKGQ